MNEKILVDKNEYELYKRTHDRCVKKFKYFNGEDGDSEGDLADLLMAGMYASLLEELLK